MSDELTLTLSSPITEEEWDLISDVDFDHTDRIWFNTKHGKKVEFVKVPRWIPCSERLPEEDGRYLVTCINRTTPHPWVRGTNLDFYGKPYMA